MLSSDTPKYTCDPQGIQGSLLSHWVPEQTLSAPQQLSSGHIRQVTLLGFQLPLGFLWHPESALPAPRTGWK